MPETYKPRCSQPELNTVPNKGLIQLISHQSCFYLSPSLKSVKIYFLKKIQRCWWLSCLEHRPVHQKIVGSIPGRDMYRRQLIDVSLTPMFLSFSFSRSLKSILKNTSLGEDFLKRYKGEIIQESLRNTPIYNENIYRVGTLHSPPLFFSIALVSQVY